MKECGDIRDRSIYLLNLGKIKIQYDNRDEIFSIGSYFGESVLKSGADINEEYDVIFLEDSVCGVLSVGRLRKMILRMSIKKTEAFNIKVRSQYMLLIVLSRIYIHLIILLLIRDLIA